MCGLTGFFDTDNTMTSDEMRAVVSDMASTITHRGPDDFGEWVDSEAGLALGFRRLAILDLTKEGHQPMLSASGRYVIAFNGEVYNFLEIRRRLEQENSAPPFRGGSDTEVMLAAVEAWGLESAVRQFVGMFAFSLWDRQDRRLHLVRDRLGVKPMYYGWAGGTFLFGSELSTLCAHPRFKGSVDRNALALYFRHCYIPAPYSIYEGISKLQPGTILTIDAENRDPQPMPYWSAKEVAESGTAKPFMGSEREAVDDLESILMDSVRLRMISDVPLGVFLSGGIDSSTVVALMQSQSTAPIKTFTIGFGEDHYNEAPYAAEIARHLGTDHTELHVTPEDALAVIPKLPTIYDEPFADSSQIPTYLVSELARRHVTVSLAGDGGDELFGGYNRYRQAQSIWQKIGWIPSPGRTAIAKAISSLPAGVLNGVSQLTKPLVPKAYAAMSSSDRLAKLALILQADSREGFYKRFVSHWKEPTSLVPGSDEPPTSLTDRKQWADIDDFTHTMMYLDTVSYLPDDILVKVDRASMAVSLEAREPMLDHRLVEFAWRLPLSMKVRNGQGKWPLLQVLYRHIPREMVDRPKKGFGVPLESWLRGPLRDWAESLLDQSSLKNQGYLNADLVRTRWTEHLDGVRNWHYYIWDVLMFQAWLGK